MKLTALKESKKGFTIIELMIATAIFAITMLVLVFGVVAISHNYYKGLTESKVQDTVRNIANELTESVELNGGQISALTPVTSTTPTGATITTNGYCIGGQEYDFILGYELQTANNASNHQAASAATQSANTCSPGGSAQNLWSGAGAGSDELLDQSMRLTKLSVSEVGTTDFYNIDVKVVFGDDDLLCNTGVPTSGPSSCSSTTTMTNTSNFTDTPAINSTNIVECKLQTGSQFCATAEINTTVEKRVQ